MGDSPAADDPQTVDADCDRVRHDRIVSSKEEGALPSKATFAGAARQRL